jgi:4-hydroxybutyrate CoA-transferase
MRKYADWSKKAVSPSEAVVHVKSGMKLFLHGASMTPVPLVEALCKRQDVADVSLYHIHTAGPAPFGDPGCEGRFFSYSLFIGAPLRKAVAEGRADFIPVFLSDIPGLFYSQLVPLDVAFLQLSPPDAHGLCRLGTSVDAAKAASETARVIIAEINEQVPKTHGNSVVPFDRITAFIHTNRPLIEHEPVAVGEVESRIGEIIANLIEDGSTLQLGIGAIPDAVLHRLKNKHDLGVHSEMFSDNLIELVDGGVITNRLKAINPGRIVTSFATGSRKLFDFVNDNPLVEFHPCDWTNDTATIRRNDKVVAINSCLQVDLTGQVCADSIGHRMYSGIGGQMDFMRGAALSKGGKPIIAFPSTAGNGKFSRITHELTPGSGVVTTRGHVHWVVTEFGAVNLHGLSLRQRGEALISIAHPEFRAELRKQLSEIRHFTPKA